jgi:hypothetical protein
MRELDTLAIFYLRNPDQLAFQIPISIAIHVRL